MSESTQLIDYRGNCHCGAFKFTFKAPEITKAFASTANGSLWGSPRDFVIVKGDVDNTLKSYEFGKRTMVHKFCPTCGTSVMARKKEADGTMSVGINIRTLADLDFMALPVITSNGAATEPPYEVPEPLHNTGPVPEGTTVYTGNCHCGAVRYTLLSPEPLTSAMECNCSICSRDAAVWVYPDTPTVKGLDSVAEYTFGRRDTYHGFCGVCGVAIYERFVGEGRDYRMALNVRTMNEVDLAALEITKGDGKALLPPYEV
ncbi:glutathione-dependent formaldehyde-activating enzyme [Mycena galericulata]|nr:glutathione-dependent formaldehyde-activating enzyme [Mycena galericulata]